MMIKSRPLEILLVEDNPGDVDLVRSALRGSSVATNLTVGRDGVEALELLRGCRKNGLFDLILLDLNLPRKNGRDVLKEVKKDVTLKRIPVIVLTSSSAPDDIVAAYDLGTNCYLTKPLDFAESKRVMRAVESFWFQAAQLPGPTGSWQSPDHETHET